jgi:signal transduction histidine kinase/CheY-like chemotaxis protein
MPVKDEPIRILVVDDEEIMLKLACDALRSQGHQVTGTSRPMEALDKLKQQKFDFILTDIKMPEMDGMELIQSAHTIDPSMGAIFMTGYASLDTAKRAIQEGAYDYILKPFDLQEIRSAVTRAIKKRTETMADGRKKGLSQLFDLNRILHAAGDSKSLLKLSLEFAMMQSRMKTGLILYWGNVNQKLQILRVRDLKQRTFVETVVPADSNLLSEWSEVKDIIQIQNTGERSLFSQLLDLLPDTAIIDGLLKSEEESIIVPLRKAGSTSGMIVLSGFAGEQKLSEEDINILAILGTQSAISMENLTLLLETQRSYRELQNLQEHVIGLERMATQGRISAEIGHELNNYLTVIMGNFELLSAKISQGQTGSLDKQLDVISSTLQKIKGFAEGLLDFSAMRAEKTECDVNDLIEKTLIFIKPQGLFRNISFDLQLEPDIPHLLADGGQIQQVLYNLLKNGADAMGKRKGEGGTITIGTRHLLEKKTVEIWVKDSGKGMSEEEQQRVFERGFTTKQSGHGMGLSICKRLIDAHGGTISVESQLNRGTSFRVELPYEQRVHQEGNSEIDP